MRKKSSVEQIQNRINAISFKGLDGLLIGDVLYFELKYNDGGGFIREIREMLKYLLNVRIEESARGDGKYLIFVEKDGAREDHINWMKKVFQTLSDVTMLVMWNKPDGKKHRENFRYLYLLFPWFFQMSAVKELSLKSRIHYTCWLAARYPYFRFLIEYAGRMDNLQCLITHCDIHCCSSLATQFLNRKGIKTVTIAHSSFLNEDTMVYYDSKSKYMVLYSDFMLKNATGFNSDRNYVVLGDPRCIGEKFNEIVVKTSNKVLAVLLSNGIDSEENMLCLEAAVWCARKMGYRLKIKKHPIEHDREIPVDCSGAVISVTSSVDIPLSEFIEECDAVITGGSNVFFECVTMLKPTFLAEVGNPNFSSIQWCKFSDGIELENLILTYIQGDSDIVEKMLALREQIAVTTDVGLNYKNFFESIID